MELDAANDRLVGYTEVLSFGFESEPGTWTCSASITLFGDNHPGTLVLTCFDVSRLSLSGFGGGLTQLLCLRIRSVEDKGWDRVNFVVEDLERQSIWFECRDFQITLS